MYRISFYVPKDHCETVKAALFQAGAGKYENYDQCCWQTLGQGQYRPLAGSDAFQGEVDKLETCEEYKVEMICSEDCIHEALAALVYAHPYEEPAYDVYKMEAI